MINKNREEQRLAELKNQEKQIQEESESKEIPSDEDVESASSEMGKTVEESSKENQVVQENTVESNASTEKEKPNAQQENVENPNENKVKETNTDEVKPQEEQKEITFVKPVDGEITRGFAKDSLVYSETLQEWIVHQAIDIKANSRDVVKAAAVGTVTAIKNDPRYGLTVIIEHEGGFKTVYSNLLTAEFVVEGEQVKQGQTLGTVGSSATFEIADEPHLHFEMLKDSEYVDPTIYIK